MAPLASFERELRNKIEGEVRFDRAALALYSTDASVYRQIPVGVVMPRHEGDVLVALTLARENSVPILPRGGGTSLAGQGCNAALVLDFSRHMRAIKHVDPQRRRAVVEPGVILSHLNAELARHDLFFPPDPTTKDRCTIGGMIGNNSCGAHSVAYGKTVDNLAGLEAVLYDGARLKLGELAAGGASETISERTTLLYQKLEKISDRYGRLVRERYPKIPRRVSGYNLDQLLPENGFNVARSLVGSEGTLAVTLQAALALAPRPQRRVLLVAGFKDVFMAADAVVPILRYRPQALEGFDSRLVEFARTAGQQAACLHLLPDGGGFLFLEFGGESLAEARERAEPPLERIPNLDGFTGARIYTGDADQRSMWALRESGLGASAVIPGYPRTWPGAEDAAVAPALLGGYLRRFAQLLAKHGLEVASYYGHFGDGCVHNRITFDFNTRSGTARYRNFMEEFADLVAEFGGSLSGEHGDGLARSELLSQIFGTELIGAFEEFKDAFDPRNRMNPGVLAHPYPLDSRLRLVPGNRPKPHKTNFKFETDGGLADAASRCVGIGKCRQSESGTMCPSYMATGAEEHSTRGRARLLFEALTSKGILDGGFGETAVKDALELCLSCKGCKRECPARVDMAAYKAEFLAHYHENLRRSPDAWLFARIHDLARFASAAPRLANWAANAPVLSRLIRLVMKIHGSRELPRFAHWSFRSWFARRPSARRPGPQVMLFPDTFTNFFEPEVAIAAVNVLERAGFSVSIPSVDLCCGRPLFDQGMLTAARSGLERALSALAPALGRDVPIVGLEPSCLLTFRDEMPALFPHDPRAAQLKENSFLFDEFLARKASHVAAPSLAGHKALVHGHCHQKAISGLDGELAILAGATGLEVRQLDSGCCGMAGAFGYGRDRFEISRMIGERVLMPAVRASPPETIIVADGFSCRTQIRHLCNGRRALHLAQVLDLAAASTDHELGDSQFD